LKRNGNKESLSESATSGISITFDSVLFYNSKSLPQYYATANQQKVLKF